jgi:hypothetical protein
VRRAGRARLALALGALASCAASTATSATRDVLRLPLKRLLPIPVVSIEVGPRDVDIGVDTGGDGALQLSREVLTQADAAELPSRTHTATNAYGESQQVRRFRVAEVRVGGRLFSNLIATESPAFKAAPQVPNLVGGIGQEFLHRFIVLIDYPKRMISLLPADATDSEAQAMGCYGSATPLKHTRFADLAISSVKVDGATMRLLWDTGAAFSTIPTNRATAYRLKVSSDPSGPPIYNTGHLLLAGSDLGPLQFVVLPVQLPPEFDGLLGYNLLGKHVVCINYHRRVVRVR